VPADRQTVSHARAVGFARIADQPVAQDRQAALHRWTLGDGVVPSAQVGKILQALALPFVRPDPRKHRHIGERVVASEPRAGLELAVEDFVNPSRLARGAVDRIGNRLRRVAAKVMRLLSIRPTWLIWNISHCMVA
jgi:hypothetical protein